MENFLGLLGYGKNENKNLTIESLLRGITSPAESKSYGATERLPYLSELFYFKNNPQVGGMATEDNMITMNPYSQLNPKQMNAVRMNEAARVHMNQFGAPLFNLQQSQNDYLNTTDYRNATEAQRKATIAARMLSGDPSAGFGTAEQRQFVYDLKKRMGLLGGY